MDQIHGTSFQGTEHQVIKDSDPRQKGEKKSNPYGVLSICLGRVLTQLQGDRAGRQNPENSLS